MQTAGGLTRGTAAMSLAIRGPTAWLDIWVPARRPVIGRRLGGRVR